MPGAVSLKFAERLVWLRCLDVRLFGTAIYLHLLVYRYHFREKTNIFPPTTGLCLFLVYTRNVKPV